MSRQERIKYELEKSMRSLVRFGELDQDALPLDRQLNEIAGELDNLFEKMLEEELEDK